jgi:antitoxin (DNA-binding transcriptional repressor) of toxin-antitoxin stability system
MKAGGVKVLKNPLSRYLKDVQAGETILVTDRERVIAEIRRPTVAQPGLVTRWEAFVNERVRLGRMRRAQADVRMRGARTFSPLGASVDIAELLAAVRANRR